MKKIWLTILVVSSLCILSLQPALSSEGLVQNAPLNQERQIALQDILEKLVDIVYLIPNLGTIINFITLRLLPIIFHVIAPFVPCLAYIIQIIIGPLTTILYIILDNGSKIIPHDIPIISVFIPVLTNAIAFLPDAISDMLCYVEMFG